MNIDTCLNASWKTQAVFLVQPTHSLFSSNFLPPSHPQPEFQFLLSLIHSLFCSSPLKMSAEAPDVGDFSGKSFTSCSCPVLVVTSTTHDFVATDAELANCLIDPTMGDAMVELMKDYDPEQIRSVLLKIPPPRRLADLGPRARQSLANGQRHRHPDAADCLPRRISSLAPLPSTRRSH